MGSETIRPSREIAYQGNSKGVSQTTTSNIMPAELEKCVKKILKLVQVNGRFNYKSMSVTE